MKWKVIACVAAVLVLTGVRAFAQAAPDYDPDNFDYYKYSTDGTPIPDVDKPGVPLGPPPAGDLSCWQATAANILAAAGYGTGAAGGAGATAQQRADHIYTQLRNDLGTNNLGYAEQAVNYWLYTYGKNSSSVTGDYMPGNVYTDVTAVRRPLHLTTVGAPNDYDFLLNELIRCQYVGVSFDMPNSDGHSMTLVGGNYWGNPNNKPDGNKSIWHDSDRDAPDTVVSVDDDVYTNAPDANGFWTLGDYVTKNATGYVTLCPGLNKPDYAMRNYDVAWYRSDDGDGVWDTVFRVAGQMGLDYAAPQWIDDNTIRIGNDSIPLLQKDVWLLVDYIDRVTDRQEDIRLRAQLVTGGFVELDPTTVTPSGDSGQLLFYWDLDWQPGWEELLFPDERYRYLYDPTGEAQFASNVKDWNVATYCGEIPEPATLTLMALAFTGVAWMRRRRH